MSRKKIELTERFKEDSKAKLGEYFKGSKGVDLAYKSLLNKKKYKPTLGEQLINSQCLHISSAMQIQDMNIALLMKLILVLGEELGIEMDIPGESGDNQPEMIKITKLEVN